MKKPTFSEFLTSIENKANAELQKQECQDLISDIHSIQSLSDSELIRRIKDLDLEKGVSDTDLQKIVPRIKSVNFSEISEINDPGAVGFLTAIIFNNNKVKYRGEKLLDQNSAIVRVFIAFNVKNRIKQIREKYSSQNINDYPSESLVYLFYEIHGIGGLEGLLGMLDYARYPPVQEIIHGIHSGRILLKRRYATKRKQYEEALAYARESWEKGDELMHHEMARLIVKNHFPNLPLAPLRKKLVPIAKEYGKFYDPTKEKQKK